MENVNLNLEMTQRDLGRVVRLKELVDELDLLTAEISTDFETDDFMIDTDLNSAVIHLRQAAGSLLLAHTDTLVKNFRDVCPREAKGGEA